MKYYRFVAHRSEGSWYEGVARARQARQVQQLLKNRGLVGRKIAWFGPEEPVLAELPGEPDRPGEAQILSLGERAPLEPDVWPIWKRVPVIGCGLLLVIWCFSLWLLGAVYGPYRLVTSWQEGKASQPVGGGPAGMRTGPSYRLWRNPETGKVAKRERVSVTADADSQPIRYWFLMSLELFGVIVWYGVPCWFIWKVFFSAGRHRETAEVPWPS